MIRKDTWCDFNFLTFPETLLMTQNMVYPGECSTCTWQESVSSAFEDLNTLLVPMDRFKEKKKNTEKVETVSDFILGGSKITADGDCSHEIKRCLLLGRKIMTNIDSILKNRDITLLTKVHLVKAMVLPVVMYGCESWTVKKAECQRIDYFELWCWRRLLRVPWTATSPF